jgi:hypothetical protein
MTRTIPLLPYIIVPFDNFSYDFGQPSGNQKLMLIFLFGGVYGLGKFFLSLLTTNWW